MARVLSAALADGEAYAVLLPRAAVRPPALDVDVAGEGCTSVDRQLRQEDRAA